MNDPYERCTRCGRLAGQHGNRRRHWRVCGPAPRREFAAGCTCSEDGWPCPDCQERF